MSSCELEIKDEFINHFFTFVHILYDYAQYINPDDVSNSNLTGMEKFLRLCRGRLNYSTFVSVLVDYCMIRTNAGIVDVTIIEGTSSHSDPIALPFTIVGDLPNCEGGKRRIGLMIHQKDTMRLLNNIHASIFLFTRESVKVSLTNIPTSLPLPPQTRETPETRLKRKICSIFTNTALYGEQPGVDIDPICDDQQDPSVAISQILKFIKRYQLGALNQFCIWNVIERALALDLGPTDNIDMCVIRVDTVTTIKGDYHNTICASSKRTRCNFVL